MITFVRKTWIAGAVAACAVISGGVVRSAQNTGPSTTQSAYVLPSKPVVTTASIISVGDMVSGGFRMVGIPDGLGAFDNGDGTFTLLMNHELGNTSGLTRSHGSKGAFVSEWVIDKKTLQVISGADLMTAIHMWDSIGQASLAPTGSFAFNRFCSGDLPEPTAFYN